jgi:DNA-binding PadR family transcriptional regulator
MAATVTYAGSRSWMHGASGPLRGALLGLVLERPGHGGDLVSRLARRLGETWKIDPTDVYRLLAGLEKEGLVSRRQEEPDGDRVGRVVYVPTESTAGALTVWLETVLPREPMRCAIYAKLAAVRDDHDARLLSHALRAYERECLELAMLLPVPAASGRSLKQVCLASVRSGVARQLEAEIDWVRETRERIKEHLA